jgi:hypothetical protein
MDKEKEKINNPTTTRWLKHGYWIAEEIYEITIRYSEDEGVQIKSNHSNWKFYAEMDLDTLISLIEREVIVQSVQPGAFVYGPISEKPYQFDYAYPTLSKDMFIQVFLDMEAKLNEEQDSRDRCIEAFQNYLSNSTIDNWNELNKMFGLVPTQRHYLFGQDDEGSIRIEYALKGQPLEFDSVWQDVVSSSLKNR